MNAVLKALKTVEILTTSRPTSFTSLGGGSIQAEHLPIPLVQAVVNSCSKGHMKHVVKNGVPKQKQNKNIPVA